MSKTSIKDKIQQTRFYKGLMKLLEDLKPMSWSQRFDHIWTYYKEYIGLFAMVAFIMFGLISSMIGAQKEVVVTGMMVNVTCRQEGVNYLSVDYVDYLGEKDEDKVKLEYTSFSDLNTSYDEKDYYAAMTVIAEVSAKKLDYLILDKVGMGFYAVQEVYMDLSKVFTQEELDDFAQRELLIYCQEKEEQKPWPAAIKINELDFVKDNITSEGDVYFALSGSSEKYEEIRAVWEYINAWQSKTQE